MTETAVVEYVARIPSPVGDLTLTATDDALTGVWFETSRHAPPLHAVEPATPSPVRRGAGQGRIIVLVQQQLEEYFAGTRTAFDLPIEFSGTQFQQRVWNLLRTIPYGATTSYGMLARQLGDPHATRAVGAANGKNPIPIIVPCHRVVGSRGELTGFGGGIDRKRWLLGHEGVLLELK